MKSDYCGKEPDLGYRYNVSVSSYFNQDRQIIPCDAFLENVIKMIVRGKGETILQEEELQKLYILGVTGCSGVGKTTFVRELDKIALAEQNRKVYVYHFDVYWMDIMYENKQELIAKFGEKMFKPDGGYDDNYFNSCDREQHREYMLKIAPEIVNRFYRSAEKEEDANGIYVADFWHLPLTPLWERCNKRVIVKSNAEERHDRLENRDYCPCSPAEAKIRDEIFEDAWKSTNTVDCLEIYNDYSEGLHSIARAVYSDIQKENHFGKC